MTKNVQGVLLKKSKLTTNGKPNLPAPGKLVEGELALNYAEGVETISTKNESGTVVTFSSDDYYTTKKLGSGFTGENSAKTVTDVINQNERITAAALNDLNANKFDTSAFTVYSGVVETTYVKKADVDQVIDSGTSASTDAVSTSAVYDFVNSHVQPNVNADWDETDETSPAFILNKPFGDECEYVVGFNGTVTLSTQAMPSGYAGAHFDAGVGGFVAGRTYRVTLDGDEFITTAVTFGGTYTGLNMEAGAESPFTDTWSMYNDGTTMFTLNGGTQGQEVSIKVEELITCTTKTIDNKYLDTIWESGTGDGSATRKGMHSNAVGQYSVAEAFNCNAVGEGSHCESQYGIASGNSSHAEGYATTAYSQYSHTEGYYTIASGNSSHAEGQSTHAIGSSSHAEGATTTALGNSSHAEGNYTTASGNNSHAEGYYTSTYGEKSHAEGRNTSTYGENSHAEGYDTIASGNSSHAEGRNTSTYGENSHAEGNYTSTYGENSHAEGYYTSALTDSSHAEGYQTYASGSYSHAEGNATSATSMYAHAEGGGTKATNLGTHAEGYQTVANWMYAHAEGNQTTAGYKGAGPGGTAAHAEGTETYASGNSSHAEGYQTTASGNYSHAEGSLTTASGLNSHAEGNGTSATYPSCHAEGNSTSARNDAAHSEGSMTYANGFASHAEGYLSVANGYVSHAEGQDTKANGNYSHAEGYQTSAATHYSHAEGQNTIATGTSSHAEGAYSVAAGNYSHAEGYSGVCIGNYSHAEGAYSVAVRDFSHAEGYYTIASGNSSHAEGYNTIASEQSSHAEGNYTKASGHSSHAEGQNTIASVDNAHAEGSSTSANGYSSHAEGMMTITNNLAEHASGQFNISNSASTEFGHSGNTLFSVGNGTGIARHNAFEIRQNGDIYIVNKAGQDVRLQDEIGNIDVDQDFSNTASTNPISTKAVYSAVTDNELVWTNAFVALSGTVSAHTANTEIHVTAADKKKLHTHSNKSALDSITGNVGTMAYEAANSYSSATEVNTALSNKLEASDIADFFDDAKYELSGTTHVINFYNDNTIKATIDATDFIKDGMIDTVSAGTSGNTTVLVITWNTDAGKSQTILDIGDMFEADNYYTTAQTSGATELSTAFAGKADTATTLAGYGITDAYTKSETSGATELATAFGDINDIIGSGFTSSSITDVIIENESIASAAFNDLNTNKLDVTAYTPVDLSNYYTKSETSGATEISNALGAKVNSATFTAHTADTAAHFTSGEKTAWNSFSASTEASINDLSGQTETIAAALVELHEEIGDIETLLAAI